MSHDIWEEGTGCSKCEAEHQDGYNALCVKESDEHGGQAHQTHNDFCNLHDGLAGRIRLQHCLIDVIGKDGACAKEIGVRAGHGGGDDACEQKSAYKGRHGVDGKDRQGIPRAH